MNNDKIGIYQIECTENHQLYIGSSKQISQRWHQHRSKLRQNKHTSPYLQHAWNKYGEVAFVFKILEECAVELLIEREQYWIDELEPQFNTMLASCGRFTHPNVAARQKELWQDEAYRQNQIDKRKGKPSPKSTPSRSGWHHTEETKAKISAASKTREGLHKSPSQETLEKRSASLKGKGGKWERTPEWREAKSKAMSGSKPSDAARRHMSEAQKRRAPDSEETRVKKAESIRLWHTRRKELISSALSESSNMCSICNAPASKQVDDKDVCYGCWLRWKNLSIQGETVAGHAYGSYQKILTDTAQDQGVIAGLEWERISHQMQVGGAVAEDSLQQPMEVQRQRAQDAAKSVGAIGTIPQVYSEVL